MEARGRVGRLVGGVRVRLRMEVIDFEARSEGSWGLEEGVLLGLTWWEKWVYCGVVDFVLVRFI